MSEHRLSKLIEKLEDRVTRRFGKLIDRHKGKFKFYIPVALIIDYFYGMFINSIHLGIAQTWGAEPVDSIWVADPFRNLFAVFTPTGLVTTAVTALLVCLITKKGYIFFSGYKFTRDKRGFDILPDGTHGTSGFLTRKEMEGLVTLGPIAEANGTILGKLKDCADDDDKYADYVSFSGQSGLNGNILCIGAPGSYKTTGLIIPFALECIRRKESVFFSDPKGELHDRLSSAFRRAGYEVRVLNFIDMAHSDSFNALAHLGEDPLAVQKVANIIIRNTNGPTEKEDFWSRAELNLLEALLYYVSRLTVGNSDTLMPIEYRSLGAVYRLLSSQSIEAINATISGLPDDHPAHGPHGNFLKAKENLWGNIAIGLGNRLAVFQSKLVDEITRYDDIDPVLPGQRPCAYFVVVSAQDETFRFLSSLFFSQCMTELAHFAQAKRLDHKLPVTVNFCLDEYNNIGRMDNMSDVLGSCRGFNMNVQAVVQSLAQYEYRYPKGEWELQEANFDLMIYMGCNDTTTAEFISKRCGTVTISVTNNQMPMMPLFSPVLHSTRPYSQTRSNTKRNLMEPDEVMRLNRLQCLAIIRGEKPMLLYKLAPEEHYMEKDITPSPISEYIPVRRRGEQAAPRSGTEAPPPPRRVPAPPPSPPEPEMFEDRADGPPPHAPLKEGPSRRPRPEPGTDRPPQAADCGPAFHIPMYTLEQTSVELGRGVADLSSLPDGVVTASEEKKTPGGGLTAKVRRRRPEEVDSSDILSDSRGY